MPVREEITRTHAFVTGLECDRSFLTSCVSSRFELSLWTLVFTLPLDLHPYLYSKNP